MMRFSEADWRIGLDSYIEEFWCVILFFILHRECVLNDLAGMNRTYRTPTQSCSPSTRSSFSSKSHFSCFIVPDLDALYFRLRGLHPLLVRLSPGVLRGFALCEFSHAYSICGNIFAFFAPSWALVLPLPVWLRFLPYCGEWITSASGEPNVCLSLSLVVLGVSSRFLYQPITVKVESLGETQCQKGIYSHVAVTRSQRIYWSLPRYFLLILP